MERADYYVYVLFRETGIPFYIGKGSGDRWKHHEQRCLKGRTRKDIILCRMLKSGLEVPKVKLAEGLTNEAACKVEIAYIAALGRYPEGSLTNLTDGGDGASHSKATKEKLSVLALNRTAEHKARLRVSLTGKVRSQEARDKMSAARSGVPKSKEWAAKIGAANRNLPPEIKAKKAEATANANRSRSPETIEKVAASHRGRKRPAATCAKMSASRLGIKLTPETRARMSFAKKNPSDQARANMGAAQKGRKHSAETIAKIKASHARRRRRDTDAGKKD